MKKKERKEFDLAVAFVWKERKKRKRDKRKKKIGAKSFVFFVLYWLLFVGAYLCAETHVSGMV
jgi:hypothetical protein